ncbi:FAD-dependent oxidoreductase [Ochrobactrum grignonense]|nr:FAD-dependent oxidoreductase [Brucella grignonensis]
MTSGGTPGNVAKAQVAIVGAGIVGVATGINLQRKGVEVLIVDERDPGEGASYGNAGVVASCAIVPVPVPGILTKLPQLLMDPMGPLAIDPIFVVRNARWFWTMSGTVLQVRSIALLAN